MESLEQYRVLGDYERKDSHQVDLFTGQLVHVIEKHDTGKRERESSLVVGGVVELINYCELIGKDLRVSKAQIPRSILKAIIYTTSVCDLHFHRRLIRQAAKRHCSTTR